LSTALEILKAGAYLFIDFTLCPSSDTQHSWAGIVSSLGLDDVYCHSTAVKIHGYHYKVDKAALDEDLQAEKANCIAVHTFKASFLAFSKLGIVKNRWSGPGIIQ